MRRRGLSCGVQCEKCEVMMFTGDVVHALLAVGHQTAVGEVGAGQGLMAGDPGAFENHEREAWTPAHVDHAENEIGGSVDRLLVPILT